MELFTKYNRSGIQDRQIDTLIGLSKGIIADGNINQAEAEFLYSWLIQNATTQNPIILNLLDKISAMLQDNFLDADESAELLSVLQKISGEKSEIGELSKSATLPIDDPLPEIIFDGKTFLFTGTCAYGTRQQCTEATAQLGGIIVKTVTKKLNYLVIGTYVSDSWIHESYGRKIEKAIEYRTNGTPLHIITEEHWLNSGKIT